MKKKSRRKVSTGSSWKEIQQSATPKLLTSHVRKRLIRNSLRGFAAIGFLVVLGVGAYFATRHWQDGMKQVQTALPERPLKEIVFETDGVLPKSWVKDVLSLPAEVDIMSIDIHAENARIQRHGQVLSSSIRRLPDRLVIRVEERRPVARLATRDPQGRVMALLVDREGVAYSGIGYDRFELESLPFLAGIPPLQREGHGFKRIQGMAQVDDLLKATREYAPHLYDTWRVVDCSNLPLLTVKSSEIREIVFGPDNYSEQLRLLAMIIENSRWRMSQLQERVDLSLGNQVVTR